MPLPTPRKGQTEQQFISDCMGNQKMNTEYPDQKQRAAVCYSQWKRRDLPGSVEYRSYVAPVEVREEKDKKPVIAGTAIVYNSRSQKIGDQFYEVVRPGALKEQLGEKPDIRALVEHDPSLIMGRTTAGTLRIYDSADGLRVEVDPPDTSYARDLMESIKRGDISGMSFGFKSNSVRDDWRREDGDIVRYIDEMRVHDVSFVTYPAYTQTHANLRSFEVFLQDLHGEERDLMERRMRMAELL